MVKCPYCGFDNEDGALFCEQCKSDLSSVPAPHAPAAEMPMAALLDDHVPMAVIEAVSGISPAIPMAALEPLPEAPVLGFADEPAQSEPAHIEPAHEMQAAAAAVGAVAAVAAAVAPAAVAQAATAPIAAGAHPKLKVIRGLKIGMEFPIYADYNYIGRADDKPVDIDLEDQEPPERVWCSRQHAVVHFEEATGAINIEDLNSSNGTFVNRTRVYPGQKTPINVNDVIQIGTVHMKLIV